MKRSRESPELESSGSFDDEAYENLHKRPKGVSIIPNGRILNEKNDAASSEREALHPLVGINAK